MSSAIGDFFVPDHQPHQPSAIFSYPAIIPISHRRFFRARPSAAPAIGRWPGGQTSGHRSSADGRGSKPSVHQTSADYVQSTITDGRYHQSASLAHSGDPETAQVYVAAAAGALANEPHEQPHRTARHMWVSLAWPGVAVRPNASWIATARTSRSLNRPIPRSRASAPPWPPCAPPCRLRANFHCASRRKGLFAAAPRRQKRYKALRSGASHR